MKDNVRADRVRAILTTKYMIEAGTLLSNHDPETGQPLDEDPNYAATRSIMFGSNLINNVVILEDQSVFSVFIAAYEMLDAILTRAASEKYNIDRGHIPEAPEELLWDFIRIYATGRNEEAPDKVELFVVTDFDDIYSKFEQAFDKIMAKREEE